MVAEYRVVWRWKTGDELFPTTREKVAIYKTEKGASAKFAKLTSTRGRFTMESDDGGYGRSQTYRLDYCRIEIREVRPWEIHQVWRG